MSKNVLTAITLIFSLAVFSQNKSLEAKKVNFSEMKSQEKINSFEKLLKIKSDSINKELLYYKVKEDYYSAALADQGNRFTLIVSGILALFTLASFGVFKYEISKVNKETKRKLLLHKKEIKAYKKKLSKTTKELKSTKGNLNTSIAIYFENDKQYLNAFIFYVGAAIGHGQFCKKGKKITKSNDEETSNFKTCISNLKLALKNLKLVDKESDNERIRTELDSTIKLMNNIYKFDNEDVKNLISEIRTELKNNLS